TTVDGLTGIDTNGANGEIEVQASDLTISQTINSGSGNITLSPNTAASTIGIGGGTGSFNLDDTEMTTGLTSTGRVTIGRAADGIGAVDIDDVNLSLETFALDIVGGSISVTGLDAAANSVALVARAGEITDGEAGTATDVTSGGLSLRATGAIGSSANPIDTSTNTIAATSGDGIFLNETDAITIGSSGGVTGLTTTGNNGEVQLSAGGSITASNVVTADGTGNVTLVASGAGSSLTISANVDTAGGDVRLLSGTGNSALLTVNNNVNSNGGDITLRADTADISANVNAGNGKILISTSTQDGTRIIDLGTEITTTLSLNDSEIDRLITNSLLTIGDTNTGDVQIWASVSPSNAANTTIISGAQIEGNSGSTLTVGGILTLDARDAIFGVSGTGGDKLALNAETLAARSRGDLNVSIVEADSVIFASSNGASSAFNGVEGGRVEVVASNSIGFTVALATNGDLLLSAGGNIDGGSNDLNAQGAVTLTGNNITIGSVTSAAGINVTASGTLSMSSILDGGNQNVSVTADDLKATTDGLLVRNAAGVTFTVDSMNIGGGDFNVDSATGIVQFSGTTDIDVSGNHNFIASTSSSTGIILNTADILAGNIQFLATSGQVQMSGGQLAVSQDGGQVNIQQNTGLSISESGIVLGGDTSFIALNILSNDFIRFFAGQRLSNALHLNSLSAVGNSTGIFVDGLLLADSAISLNSGSGFIHAGVNPIIAGGSLAINATGSAGSDIQAGTLTGVGVNLLALDGITLARTIDALGGSVNINTTTLTGRNGLELRNVNPTPPNITAQVVLQSGVFTINGVNQIVNTGVKVTGSRSPLLTATSNQPDLLEAQTIQSLRVVDEVTRTMEANRILEDIQALTSLANSLESAPNSFDRLMKTNEWLREAQTVIDYTREMLRKAGKDTDIAGEIFISLYCSDLAESHPKAFKLLKGLAAPEDEEKAESKE
ncbi:MAG: hypothetical protein O3B01_25700, partial [Planctomycetota bacterium]|nr:hypothetical protein [Planctomycetota bacterium]